MYREHTLTRKRRAKRVLVTGISKADVGVVTLINREEDEGTLTKDVVAGQWVVCFAVFSWLGVGVP